MGTNFQSRPNSDTAAAGIDEAAVVARCQRGDRAAFRELYEAHSTSLFRVALLMTGSREEAEDLLQDTFTNAWKGIGSYREEAGIGSWLVTILLNRVRSWRRRIARRTAKLSFVPLDTPGPEPSYEDRVSDPVEMASLVSALQKLSVRHRCVIVLRFYSGLSVPEIARTLDCPEGTVKSQLHRSLENLRTHMDVSKRLAMFRSGTQSQPER